MKSKSKKKSFKRDRRERERVTDLMHKAVNAATDSEQPYLLDVIHLPEHYMMLKKSMDFDLVLLKCITTFKKNVWHRIKFKEETIAIWGSKEETYNRFLSSMNRIQRIGLDTDHGLYFEYDKFPNPTKYKIKETKTDTVKPNFEITFNL